MLSVNVNEGKVNVSAYGSMEDIVADFDTAIASFARHLPTAMARVQFLKTLFDPSNIKEVTEISLEIDKEGEEIE